MLRRDHVESPTKRSRTRVRQVGPHLRSGSIPRNPSYVRVVEWYTPTHCATTPFPSEHSGAPRTHLFSRGTLQFLECILQQAIRVSIQTGTTTLRTYIKTVHWENMLTLNLAAWSLCHIAAVTLLSTPCVLCALTVLRTPLHSTMDRG